MTNLESELASFDIAVSERFSKKVGPVDAGLGFAELFMLALMICYAIRSFGEGTAEWSEIILTIVGCVVMAVNTWSTFKDLYVFCAYYGKEKQAIKTCIDVSFDNADKYQQFRTLMTQHAEIPLVTMIIAALHANGANINDVKVDMTEIRFNNRQKRAVVRAWGNIK